MFEFGFFVVNLLGQKSVPDLYTHSNFPVATVVLLVFWEVNVFHCTVAVYVIEKNYKDIRK